MAGYSANPLVKKLGICADHRIVLLSAPVGFHATLGALPPGVEVKTNLRGSRPFDVMTYFTRQRKKLALDFPRLRARMKIDGAVWIAWPKKSSGVSTDLREGAVREIGLDVGLVDTKVCAIDDIWSGLKFVVRVKDR